MEKGTFFHFSFPFFSFTKFLSFCFRIYIVGAFNCSVKHQKKKLEIKIIINKRKKTCTIQNKTTTTEHSDVTHETIKKKKKTDKQSREKKRTIKVKIKNNSVSFFFFWFSRFLFSLIYPSIHLSPSLSIHTGMHEYI